MPAELSAALKFFRKYTIFDIFVFTVWNKKKSSDKIIPLMGIEPGPSDSKFSMLLSTTNLTFAYKIET